MNLTPGISTHFRLLSHRGNISADLTVGEIYKILEWEGGLFSFLDDVGDVRLWTAISTGQYARTYTYSGKVECVMFETNLEKVLEQ